MSTPSTLTNAAPSTTLLARPRFEGANIRTWIGFKHLLYLVEEAVLEWFRERELGPQRLFREYGLGLEIVEASASLIALLEVDDIVVAEAAFKQLNQFSVRLIKQGNSDPVAVKAKVKVSVLPSEGTLLPEALAAWISNPQASDAGSNRRLLPGETVKSVLTPPGSHAFLWSWRARYFHCQYSEQVQHSAYVRAVEEVVDRFLAERGISIRRMLKDYHWIPVVSRVRVVKLAEAFMEETIHTTFVVDDVMKGITFDGRMDCYVLRGDDLVHTATARILHGYAISEGERAGQLTSLDQATLDALTGETQE